MGVQSPTENAGDSAGAPSSLAFLSRGGELGRLIAGYDWDATSLGPPSSWPESLRTLVGVMLAAEQPMFIAWGPEQLMLYNQGYAPMLADRHPGALGRPFMEVWREVRDELTPLFGRVWSGEPVHMDDIELQLDRPGRPREAHFSFSYTPVLDAAGRVDGLFCACTETTEQVLAARTRQIAVDRQLRIFEQMPGYVSVLSGPDHVYEFVNHTYVEMFGARDYIGRTAREVFADLQDPSQFELLDRVYTSGEPVTAHAMGFKLASAAQERFFDFLWEPLRDEAGAVTGIFAGGYEVTDLVLTQKRHAALVSLDDRLRDVPSTADLAFTAAKLLGEIMGASRVGFGMIDIKAETVTIERNWNAPGCASVAGVHHFRNYGTHIDDLKRGDIVKNCNVLTDPRTAARAEVLLGIGVHAHLDVPVVELGTAAAMMFVHSSVPREWTDEEGAFVRDFAIRTRAAIARRLAEQELRDLNDNLEARVAERTADLERAWRMSQDLLVELGRDGVLTAVNRAWESTLGWSERELVGTTFMELAHPEDLEDSVRQFRKTFETPLTEPYEFRLRHKDGSYRWLAWTAAFEDGCVSATGRDVTGDKQRAAELEATQEALRQSQKMEAMGQLTGGVAHDFNNLLTPIVGSLDLLQRKGLGDAREQRLIAGALQSADRAKTLVQRLLAFARRQPLQASALDVRALVDGMADLLSSTTGPQIKLVVDMAGDLPAAVADPNQLEMALLNLGVNARDAMPDGGTLRISADAQQIGTDNLQNLQPGAYVRLSVADTGVGMDEATRARAIEPFFSTKGTGRGTGLGLSMAHGLASQLGGGLFIHSRVGVGTNIELWLPAAEAPAQNREPSAGLADGAAQSGTALLVDDEELVRISTADMLTDLGFQVVEAASAEEALTLLRQGLHPEVLVTDHLMPGMNGTDLARTVQAEQPATRILIVSGYAETEGGAPEFARLAKPFRNADLAAALTALDCCDVPDRTVEALAPQSTGNLR